VILVASLLVLLVFLAVLAEEDCERDTPKHPWETWDS